MEGIPSLAGQPPLFIVTQMILFREGLRQVPAMQAFAQGLPDRDIEDLAAYYASLPPGPPEDRRARDDALFAEGQALMGPRNCACATCRRSRVASRCRASPASARISWRAPWREYRDGVRVGADSQMNGAVMGLTDAQIAALAHYLAQRD